MNRLTLIFLVLIFPMIVFSQSKIRKITDRELSGRIIKALEENDILHKKYIQDRYAQSYFLIAVYQGDALTIQDFRVLNKNGNDIITMRSSEDDIKFLLGEDIVKELKEGKYQYEIIEPEKITSQLSFDQSRDSFWWSAMDVELSADRCIIKSSDNFGLYVSQGEPIIGYPQHLSGFSRFGFATKMIKIGVQAPINIRGVSNEKRKLDGGIGGFGSFYLYEGAIGIGGTGYFQIINNASYVNYIDSTLTFRSVWGGAGYVDYYFRLGGDEPTLHIMLGVCAFNVERGMVQDKKIIQNSLDGQNNDKQTNISVLSPLLLIRYCSKLIPKSSTNSEIKYRSFETTIGYTGEGVYGSLSYFPFTFLGLNIQGIYYSRQREWQQKYVVCVSPILRFNF